MSVSQSPKALNPQVKLLRLNFVKLMLLPLTSLTKVSSLIISYQDAPNFVSHICYFV